MLIFFHSDISNYNTRNNKNFIAQYNMKEFEMSINFESIKV